MAYLIGKSAVEDFETWHAGFKDNESFRAENGEVGYQVFQSKDNPDEATVIFQWDENDDPRAFFQSEEMQRRMTDAGLVGPPEMTLVELVDEKVPQQPSA